MILKLGVRGLFKPDKTRNEKRNGVEFVDG
jgi:hypothetical protein